VANSSVPLMSSNTSIASSEKPAGPVTATSSPPPLGVVSSRSFSVASISSSSASPLADTLVMSSAALPSSESCGGDSGMVSAGTFRLNFARSRAIAARSRAVSPPSRL
jgi:hypothetical protein